MAGAPVTPRSKNAGYSGVYSLSSRVRASAAVAVAGMVEAAGRSSRSASCTPALERKRPDVPAAPSAYAGIRSAVTAVTASDRLARERFSVSFRPIRYSSDRRSCRPRIT
jgi:hypothetical protein